MVQTSSGEKSSDVHQIIEADLPSDEPGGVSLSSEYVRVDGPAKLSVRAISGQLR